MVTTLSQSTGANCCVSDSIPALNRIASLSFKSPASGSLLSRSNNRMNHAVTESYDVTTAGVGGNSGAGVGACVGSGAVVVVVVVVDSLVKGKGTAVNRVSF